MQRARHAYAVSAALAGSTQLVSASLATPATLGVDVEYRKVMGIGLPKLAVEGSVGKLEERGYGIISTHPSVDAVASEYERGVGSMVKLAETESSLHALADEVGKTKRRVNALEYRVVPQLSATRRYIHMRLDELEREEFYRKKMVKGKKLRAEGEI